MNVQSSSDKPIIDVLSERRISSPPPFWFMRQAGRFLPEYRELRGSVPDFLTLCYSPDLACEVTLQPIRRFHPDAAIIFADILLIPDGLGQTVRYVEGRGPQLEPTIRSAADIATLKVGQTLEHVSPVFESLRRVRRELPADTALIGFAGAPWTVAVYMVEGGSSTQFMSARTWAARAPEEFGALIDLLVNETVEYLVAQVAAGAEVIQIFDTWSGLLAPPAFQRWCVEPVREIVERFKSQCPQIPVIAFPRGAGSMLIGYGEATGVDAVSLDSTVTADWAAENIGQDIALQGNLDPSILVAGGSALDRDVDRILSEFAPYPHVFNLGHGIVPETPPEHVAQLCEQIRGWRPSTS